MSNTYGLTVTSQPLSHTGVCFSAFTAEFPVSALHISNLGKQCYMVT